MRKLLLGVLTAILAIPASAQMRIIVDSAWEFRRTDENVRRRAAVPGTVHTDLLAHRLIPDPFAGANEKGLQWIDKKDWEYRTSFLVPPVTLQYDGLALDFTGLDTHADAYLNDQLILKAQNMFAGETGAREIIPQTRPEPAAHLLPQPDRERYAQIHERPAGVPGRQRCGTTSR